MMKKYLFTLLLFVGIGLNAFSTTYTSAQNGNWMNPMTWSPIGIPLPGDDITINHAVVMDTSFAYTSGSIIVNNGSSLVNDSFGRDLWLNGVNATLTNNGTVDIRYLLLSNGSFINTGFFNVKSVANYSTMNNNAPGEILGVDSLYNDGIFNNTGIVHIVSFYNNSAMTNTGIIKGSLANYVDSMYNNGTFINNIGAQLRADSCTNTNIFTNNGIVLFNQFTNWNGNFSNSDYVILNDMTNTGTFINQDTLIVYGSITNTGNLDNQSQAWIDISVSFLNADTVNNNATYTADGRLEIGDSFYNFDNVSGSSSGIIQVTDTSYNSGTMTGSFDFCDATPPPSSPYIDINLGTVDPLITYCAATTINENKLIDFTIYPNPTEGYVYFGNEKQFVQVFSAEGKKIIDDYTNQINLKRFDSGIYYLMINDEKGNRIYSEKIIKE